VCAHREAFQHTLPTAVTVLAGVGRRHRDHSTASVCCITFEDGPKWRPARVADAVREMATADHVGDPQIFEVYGVELSEQRQRGLVVEVAPLALRLLLFTLQQGNGPAAPPAAFLAPRDPTQGLDGIGL
jgi:hypothetical protein